jgi:hypothetical protein
MGYCTQPVHGQVHHLEELLNESFDLLFGLIIWLDELEQ